jgi:glycosyltransferase involved in cell wall biosynthesis
VTASDGVELSVIIATHDRRELLRRCLESLSAQTQDPATFEVIVADDGSGDGSAEMAEAFEAPFRLRVLGLEQGGQAHAQNAAVEQAEGAICLLLDDDMIASPELVAAHIDAHSAEPLTLGVGAITQRPPAARDWYAHAFARSWNAHYEEFAERSPGWIDCYGANLSFPLAKLREIDGVTTDIAATFDLELGARLSAAGCIPTFLPRAHGVHDDQKRRGKMLKNAERQGETHVELARRRPGMAPELLDWRGRAGQWEVSLRRLLLALRVPPTLLAKLGPMVPGNERELLWYSIVRRFAFWRGVRRSISRDEWALLTRTPEEIHEYSTVIGLSVVVAEAIL